MSTQESANGRTPSCGECIAKTKPGSQPACLFEREVLTLVNAFQDQKVDLPQAKLRLGRLSQTARQRECPNISSVRGNLEIYIDPRSQARRSFASFNLTGDASSPPHYEFNSLVEPKRRRAKSSH